MCNSIHSTHELRVAASIVRYRSRGREARRRFALRGLARVHPGASVSSEMRARVLRAADQLGYRVNRLAQSLINARSQHDRAGRHRSPAAIPRRASGDALERAARGRLSMHVAQRRQCRARHECADRACARVSRLCDRRDDRHAAVAHRRGLPEQRRAGHPRQQAVARTRRRYRRRRPRRRRAARGGTGCLPPAAGGSSSCRARRGPQAWSAGSTHFAHGRPKPASRFASGKTARPTIAGREAALSMLAEEPFDGAFCVTDLLALGFLDAARSECGRRVPQDLSVIGFDDIPQAGWSAYRAHDFPAAGCLLTDA